MGAMSKIMILLLFASLMFTGMAQFLNAGAEQQGREKLLSEDLEILGNVTTLTDDFRQTLNQAINSAINPINGILIITNSAFQAIGLLLQTPLILMKAITNVFGLTPFIPVFILDHLTLMAMIISAFILVLAFLKVKA